jgi:hypothetical protein
MDAVKLESFMSWIPLVGSALGSVVAGFVSDWIVKRNIQDTATLFENQKQKAFLPEKQSKASNNVAVRALIAGVSTLLSLPFVGVSFLLGFPGCFLIYIASGVVSSSHFMHCVLYAVDCHDSLLVLLKS